jgi:hypothetical protein
MSPRKRTTKKSTEGSTVAEMLATETGADAEPPIAETPAEMAEVPTVEAGSNGQTFADKVGKKQWKPAPDPFPFAKDNLAGVRIFESKQDEQMAIKFEEKPSQAVIDRMKEAGYRWNSADKIWAHPVFPEAAMSIRIDAEKLYQEVRQMIRQEKGIEADQGQGVPF